MTLAGLCSSKGNPNLPGLIANFLAGGYQNDPELMAVLRKIQQRKNIGDPNWLQEGIWDLQDFQKYACPNGPINLPHQFRNVFQSCPEKEPKCEPENWDPEEFPFHHPNQCYRGLGAHSGSQCCYDPSGNLDDYSPAMGTWDYFPPGTNTQLHTTFDVIPH